MNTAQKATVRCTRRIRDPLNYLIMQATDPDQVTTSIRTRDASMVTFYLPQHNLQHVLHKRYEAEQFGEMVLPKGTAPPAPKPLMPTAEMLEEPVKAAATLGPRLAPRFLMSAPDPSSPGASPRASAVAEGPSPSENQLNNYVNPETGDTIVPLGLVTLIIGRNYPSHQTWLERMVDPAPHVNLSMRVMVMDRIHWQRTSWMASSMCKSLCWGRLPQRIFSINLDYKHDVVISGGPSAGEAKSGVANAGIGTAPLVFDPTQQRYTSPYQVDIPELGFRMRLRDTGRTLFDPETRVVDGFLDNESALHRLALPREVNMLGLGGSVYRQTLWSSPSLPNTATVEAIEYGQLFERVFGCSPVGEPVSTWLVEEVEKTLIYQMEGEVEDENDPNSATTYGDRSLTERVQKKAMNRYNGFRDEVRGRTYSEVRGEEMPR